MQSSDVKIFASDIRISKSLTWPQNVTVPTIYFHFCDAIRITLGTFLDMCLTFISNNVAF